MITWKCKHQYTLFWEDNCAIFDCVINFHYCLYKMLSIKRQLWN